MSSIEVITHRGLEPSNPNFPPESSVQSLSNQSGRGYGLEFDPNITKDGIVVWHDQTLERLSEGKDTRSFRNLTVKELSKIRFWNKNHTTEGVIPTFDEVMELIRQSSANVNALHLKGKYQNPADLEILIEHLKKNSDVLERILIFDVKVETAKSLLRVFPEVKLAPSVANEFDVFRYNSLVGETLYETSHAEELLMVGVFGEDPFVWLDEWNRKGRRGRTKTLYTRDVFNQMRAAGAKIALVTPELHGGSPGRYEKDSHEDAKDQETLFKRIKQIIRLKPDLICTDYPQEALELSHI